MVAGPVFYRRLVSSGVVDRAFAQRIVDRVLTSFLPPPGHRSPKEPLRTPSDTYFQPTPTPIAWDHAGHGRGRRAPIRHV